MKNVEFIDIEINSKIESHAIIDIGNNEYISMPKSIYDEQQLSDIGN